MKKSTGRWKADRTDQRKEKELQELAQAEATDEDYTAVKEMEERIAAASGEVKLEDEETLKKIRSDFDAMTKDPAGDGCQLLFSRCTGNGSGEAEKDTRHRRSHQRANCSTWRESPLKVKRGLTALRKDYTALTTAQKKIWSEIMSCLHRQKINWQISNYNRKPGRVSC